MHLWLPGSLSPHLLVMGVQRLMAVCDTPGGLDVCLINGAHALQIRVLVPDNFKLLVVVQRPWAERRSRGACHSASGSPAVPTGAPQTAAQRHRGLLAAVVQKELGCYSVVG
jgi:hypothetical protein